MDWISNLIVTVVLATLVGGFAAFLFTLANHSGHVSCLRLHEATGLETRYQRSGVNGDCYIKINGTWTPEDNWRNQGEH